MRKTFAFNRIVAFALVMVMVIIMVPTHFFPKAAEEAPSTVSDRFIRSGDVSVQGMLPRGTLLKAKTVDNPFALNPEEFHVASLKGASFVNGISPAPVTDEPAVPDESEILTYSTLNYIGFYDISLYKGGADVQPDGSAEVVIRNIDLSGTSGNVKVIHILDSEDAIRDAQKRGTAIWVNDTRFVKSFAEEAALAESVTGKAGIVIIEELAANVNDARDQISFRTNSFSIYGIVDTQDDARLNVIFKNGDTEISSVMITSVQAANQNALDSIIYDPGTGTLAQGELFRGWTTEQDYTKDTASMTIEQVRQDVVSRVNQVNVDDTVTVTYYAMVFRAYTVIYLDEDNVSLGADSVLLKSNGQDEQYISYTVSMAYTHLAADQNFEGWKVSDGGSNIQGHSSLDQIYPNDTVIQIKGNVVFSVNAPHGNWLVFNENGKGATYCAPQFIKSGEVTVRPRPDSEMKRNGYTFGGWFTDEACTAGNEFEFGHTISERTMVYAKWTANTIAAYTILIWKQNLSGDGYDFVEAVHLTGNVGSTINTVIQQGTGNNAYARINGTNKQYTGFHLKEFDQNVVVKTEGNSVLNVYYDRNEHTLNFQIWGYTYTYTPTTSNDGTQYGLVNGQYVQLTRHNNGSWWNPDYYWTYGNNNRYTGTRYTRSSSSGWQTIKEITALYGQSISDEFPIVGSNGVTYDQGERWMPQNSSTYNQVLIYIDTMPNESVTFRLDEATHSTKYIYYYVEALPGEQGTRTYNGKSFVLYKNLAANYGFFTEAEDYLELLGYTKYGYTPNNAWGSGGASTVYCYYTRKVYSINFMDGVYVDGNGNPLEEESRGQLHTVDNIPYQTNLSSYNKGGANYYTPETLYENYVFEGWYIDSQCIHPYTFSKMAEGITVYAKWRIIQYRVFLHPNAGTDPTLDWGDSELPADQKQQMNFRVSYGDKISAPTGLRTDYEFIGWFMDEACTRLFNDEVYVLNETTVTSEYNKNTDFTDPMDKWGNGATSNGDLNRFWITKKFDLYAKWRKTLNGAEGISVIYDANGGTNAPSDTRLYLDNVEAIAGAASTPANTTTHRFKYWVLQTWDGEKFVDTDIRVYPGGVFTVLKDNAREIAVEGEKIEYTVQLRAEYGPIEGPVKVRVTYNANGGTFKRNPSGYTLKSDSTVLELTEEVVVNTALDLLLDDPNLVDKPGCIFKGWSFTPGGTVVFDENTPASHKIAADQLVRENGNDETNTLYAVWEEVPVYPVVVKKTVSNGSLTINTEETFNFTYTVTYPDGYQPRTTDASTSGELTITVTGTTPGTATITNVPEGSTVTVTEIPHSSFDTTYNPSTHEISNIIAEGLIEVTNTRKTVTVTVKKEVESPFASDNTKPFSFTAQAFIGETQIGLITEDAGFELIKDGIHQITLPAGARLVVTEAEYAAYTTTPSNREQSIESVAGGENLIFKNVRNTATVNVTKNVVGFDADTAKTFNFTVTSSSGSDIVSNVETDVISDGVLTFALADTQTRTITVPAGANVTITEEDYSDEFYTDVDSTLNTNTYTSGQLDKDDVKDVTFTNTRKVTVKAVKVIDNSGSTDTSWDNFAFPVTFSDGTTGTVIDGDAAGATTTVRYGTTVSVTEDTSAQNDGVEVRTVFNTTYSGSVEAITEEPVITITNTRKVFTVIVTKTAEGFADGRTFNFTSTGLGSDSFTLGNGGTKTFENIPYGTVITVTEADGGAEYIGTRDIIGGTVNGENITVDSNVTINYNNAIQSYPVIVTKTVTSLDPDDTDPAKKTFTITVNYTLPNGTSSSVTLTLGNGQKNTDTAINKPIVLPYGSTYTVTETLTGTDADNFIDPVITNGSGTVTGDTSVTVKNERDTVKIDVAKVVTYSGDENTAFNFHISAPGVEKDVTAKQGTNSAKVLVPKGAAVTITETGDLSAWTVTSTAAGQKGNEAVIFDATADTTATFTNKREPVKVTVTKVLTPIEGITIADDNTKTFPVKIVYTDDDGVVHNDYVVDMAHGQSVDVMAQYGSTVTVSETVDANFKTPVITVNKGTISNGSVEATEEKTVTVTNERDTVQVTVTKTVDKNADTTTAFDFTAVATLGGKDVTLKAADAAFSLTSGQSKIITLPKGATITVTEATNANFYPTVDGAAGSVKEITTPITEATQINFVNYKTQIVQVKKVFKSIVIAESSLHEFEIVVNYVDETGASKTKKVKLFDGQVSDEIIVRYGSDVTLSESVSEGFKEPQGTGTFTITEDKTGEKVLVVTNERKTVKVTVTKTVVGTEIDKKFAFYFGGHLEGSGLDLSSQVPDVEHLGNGDSFVLIVPEGSSVTVGETEADGYNTYINGVLDADREIVASQLTGDTTINFTNVELIDINFEKVIVNKGITLPVFESFFVNYTDAKEGAKTVELKRADDYKATVTVEYGTALSNITEDVSAENASGIAVGTVYVPSYNMQSVPGTAKATVTITNTVKDYTLTVKKVTDDGAAGSFALTLATINVEPAISDSTKSVAANDANGVTYTLPYGAIFTLVENLTPEQLQYYSAELAKYVPSENASQVEGGFTITGDGLITITNFRNPVTVTVTKTVVSDVTADFTNYTFRYTYVDKNNATQTENVTVTVPAPASGNTSSGTASFSVPAQSTVTVEETGVSTDAFKVEYQIGSGNKTEGTTAELGKLTALQTSVTFTNTRKTFDVDLTKNVVNFTGDGSAKYPITVTVKYGNQTLKVERYELSAGEKVTIHNVPYGADVDFSEDSAAPVKINDFEYSIGAAFDTTISGVSFNHNEYDAILANVTENGSVIYTNTRKTVTATVTKKLDNKGVSDKWSTFYFPIVYTITDNGTTYRTVTLLIDDYAVNGTTVTVTDIPFGATIEVNEDTTAKAEGQTHTIAEVFTVGGDNGKSAVAATTAPVFEIVNTRKIVNVTIVKNVLSDDAADIKDYTFNVTTAVANNYAGTDVTKSGTQTVTVGSNKTGSVTFPIPAGTDVTIVETGVSAAKFETFVAIDNNAARKQLDASLTDVIAAHTVTYTNRKLVNVTVVKIVDSTLAADLGTYTFNIGYHDIDIDSDRNVTDNTANVTAFNTAASVATFQVPYGTTNLSVAEVLGNAAGSFTTALDITGAAGTAGDNNQSATVATVNVDTTLTFTNTRKMQTITVEKTVDSLLAADLKTYTFTYGYKYYAVSGEQTVANATIDVTVSSAANPATATFEIPYDAHAFEISEPDNSGATTVLTTVTGTGSLANGTASDANRKYAVTAKITADGKVSFTNRRVVYFDVRKILDSLDSGNDFTFEYSYTYKGTEVKQQITIEDVPVDTTGKAYAPVIEIPYGVEVTVTETTADGYSTFVLVPGGSASTEGVTGTAVITSGTEAKPAEFVFTNHRVIPFTIIKTVDSDETTPVTEYSFTVAYNYNGTADSRDAAVNVSDGDTTGDGIYTGTTTIYIPYGAANVTVTETPVTGYDTEAEGHINGSPAQGANTGSSEYVKNIYTFTDAITKAADVAFVNTRTVEVTVIKELDSEETDAMTSTFNFNYTYTGTNHETTAAVPFTVKMPNALTGSTVIRVPYGVTLTVNELVDQTNYDTYYGFNGAATGTAGTTAEFANAIVDNNSSVKFSNKRMVNVKFIKNVDNPALSAENNKYTFTYTYTYNNTPNTPDPVVITVDTTSAMGETGYFRIPYNAANFVVTETIDLRVFDVDADSTGTAGTLNGAAYTLSQNVTAVNTDIHFYNQRMVEVEVVKKVESSEQADKNANYSVTYGYTRTANGSIASAVNITGQTGTINDATDGNLTVRMPYGSTFTVTETGDLSKFQVLYSTTDNTALTEGKEVSLANVTASKTVTFTNRKLYTVTVTKTVDNKNVNDGLQNAAFPFTYTVSNTVGYNVPATDNNGEFTLTNNGPAKVITVPYGAKVVVSETTGAKINTLVAEVYDNTNYTVADFFTTSAPLTLDSVSANTTYKFSNVRKTRDIIVSKTVKSKVATDFTNTYVFNYTVDKLFGEQDKKSIEITPVGTDASIPSEGNVTKTEKITVPVGLEVTVKESGAPFAGVETMITEGNGVTIAADDEYKAIVAAGLGNVTVIFVNTRVTADLTITKVVNNGTTRTFIFSIDCEDTGYHQRVMIQGADADGNSVTIKDLLTGYTYTVTELTGWSWEFNATAVNASQKLLNPVYADTKDAATFLFVDSGVVTFTNVNGNTNWLRTEAYLPATVSAN